jgi:hypothetical protein
MREEVVIRVGMRGGASWKNGHGIEAGLLENGRIISRLREGSGFLQDQFHWVRKNSVVLSHCAGTRSATVAYFCIAEFVRT